jgi:hypothetical protein
VYCFHPRFVFMTTESGIKRIRRSVETLSVSCIMMYLCQIWHCSVQYVSESIIKHSLCAESIYQ